MSVANPAVPLQNPGKDSDLFDYHLVDTSVEALKFDAAASYQLPNAHAADCQHPRNDKDDNLLVVSPYTARSHLLDLSTVSKECQLFAKALTVMKPVRDDYATATYQAAFNWECVVEMVRTLCWGVGHSWPAESFYIVVFRSRVPPTTDRSHLGMMDDVSHEEAMESGGLLKYWFGVPDESGRNLATCLWRNREDAKRGSAGAGHQRAMMATRGFYTEWKLERLRFTIGDGAQHWSIDEWEDN
ncbi:MAG: hypothetical protein M1825_003790 [Sarcosagium campestre]|nr:MAG: hypothetical protein M1825_003790 [Sarcosagium campestre]